MNEMLKWGVQFVLVIASLTGNLSQANTHTQQLNIAVAANFLQAFEDIRNLYKNETGHDIHVSTGSTGQLYHQIVFGASYDIFFSADLLTSQRLISEKKALANSYDIYTQGRLVLLSNKPLLISDNINNFHSVLDNNRIAIANPKTAPYGKAAQQVLNQLLPEQVPRKNLITGQNVTQVFQFIESGNVDMGFISLAQLRYAQSREKKQYQYWLVPQSLHNPIEQSRVVLSSSTNIQLAMEFLDFMASSKVKKIINFYGYE